MKYVSYIAIGFYSNSPKMPKCKEVFTTQNSNFLNICERDYGGRLGEGVGEIVGDLGNL